MIVLRSINKTYGTGAAKVHALRGIDIAVESGQFVSIMGPSGCGKSTLLNLISAVDTATSGKVEINGQDIAALDDDALTVFRRRQIGLVFQFFNLLPTLNALDNTLLPVMLERTPLAADRERAAQLLHDVGLGQRVHHHMHQLSGGEKQRVAIARAMILKPSLLLADEPTGNLDSSTGAAILNLLKRTCESTGTTIVMVTHDAAAAQVGHRILWLKDGLIQRDELFAPAAAQ